MDPTTVAQTLAAYAQPARPYSPTPTSESDIADALYGLPTPMTPPPPPLPAWIPKNVQNYINTQPSYAEGERQGWPSNIAGGEPYSPTPQVNDIQRLFGSRIMGNAPIYAQDDPVAASKREMLKKLMQLPNFGGFTGGEDI